MSSPPSATVTPKTVTIDPELFYKQRLLLAYLEQYEPESNLIAGINTMLDDLVDAYVSATGDSTPLLRGTREEDEIATQLVAALVQNYVASEERVKSE